MPLSQSKLFTMGPNPTEPCPYKKRLLGHRQAQKVHEDPEKDSHVQLQKGVLMTP
jgi:hypothetical protein